MHRIIGRVAHPFAEIRPGEGVKTALMACYFYLTITAYYIVKPVRNSLFITHLGADQLPYVYLGTACCIGLIVSFYARYAGRLRKDVLLSGTTLVLASHLLLFRWAFSRPHVVTSYLFYIWVSVFSILIVTQFWMLANDLFTSREAKRLFGLVGSGGILGGVSGGLLAGGLVDRVGTENLLYVSAGLLGVCALLIKVIWERERRGGALAGTAGHADTDPAGRPRAAVGEAITLLFSSRYLVLLLLVVGLAKIVSTLVDYQFNVAVEAAILTKDARTDYYAQFYAWLNGVAFLLQFYLTTRLIRRWGVGVVLGLLPVGLLAGSVGLVLLPSLLVARLTALFDGSVNYSVYQSAKEVLYLPIAREIRYRVKPLIDVATYRLSKGVAAAVILLMTKWGGGDAARLGWVSLVVIGGWLAVVWAMGREYPQQVRQLLEPAAGGSADDEPADPMAAGDPFPNVHREAVFKRIRTLLDEPLSGREPLLDTLYAALRRGDGHLREIQAALRLESAFSAPPPRVLDTGEVLTVFDSYEHVVDALVRGEVWIRDGLDRVLREGGVKAVHLLARILGDPQTGLALRKRAALLIGWVPSREALWALETNLAGSEVSLRYNVIKGLNRLRGRAPAMRANPTVMAEMIGREASSYCDLFDVVSSYAARRASETSGAGGQDLTVTMLGHLLDESFERIFRLLGVVYRQGDVSLVYNRLLTGDDFIRQDAIELLDSLLGWEIRRSIFPMLERDLFLLHDPRGTVRAALPSGHALPGTIERLLAVRDRWLQLCLVFVIYRFGLADLYGRVRRGALADPVVARAVDVAGGRVAGDGGTGTWDT